MIERSHISYVKGHSLITQVSRGRGLEKALHTLTLERGSNPFLRNILQVDILYYKSRDQVLWQGSHFICVWKVKNCIRMSCFSITDPFFNMLLLLKNEMESYVRIGGRGLKNLTYPYMGVGGVKITKIILT